MISVERVLFTDVGEGLHEAEILQWFVNVGDTVERDEALVELQTDKVAIEVTAPKKESLCNALEILVNVLLLVICL